MAEAKKNLLSGKKSYIVMAIMFVIGGAHAIKALVPVLRDTPDEVFQQVMAFVTAFLTSEFTLGGAAIGAIKAAIVKTEK